jgi:Tfp pilus assembly protein PilO
MAIINEEYDVYRKYIKNIASFYKKRSDIRAYIELGLSLLAIIVFLIFAIQPSVTTIAEKINEIQTKQETVSKLDQKIALLETANSLLQNESSTLALLDEAVPFGSKPEEYLLQIDALAIRNGLTLTSAGIETTPLTIPTEQSTPPSIAWFPYSVTVNGEYEELFAFLEQVESLRRPIRIVSVNFEDSITEGLRLSIEGEIPYYTFTTTNEEQP